MSLRRYHRKSRAGCTQCRVRRVKCDEQGPPCSNCNIRDMQCEYSSHAQLARQAHAPRQEIRPAMSTICADHTQSDGNETTFGSILHGSMGPSKWDQRRTELELTIHWTCQTCLTFCHGLGQTHALEELKLWQEKAPRYALDYPYLLDAMFSLTSLHLATQTNKPSIKTTHIANGTRYYISAINAFVEALPLANENNCLALYICSLTILVLSITLPQIGPICNVQQADMRRRIIEVLQFLESSRRTLRVFRQQLNPEVVSPILAELDMAVYAQRYTDFEQALIRLRRCNDVRLMRRNDSRSINHHQSMANALRELEACSICLANGIGASLIGWLKTVESDYIEALKHGDALANLIMMHWAVLLTWSNDLWWNINCGEILMQEYAGCFFNFTDEEVEAYNWCHEQCSLRSYHIAIS